MNAAEYGIASWDAEKWGNHRALVEVTGTEKKVKVQIPWRRCDRNAEKKGVFVRYSDKDLEVPRVYIHQISREVCELAFDTAGGPGLYEIYYMRYGGTTRAPYPVIAYHAQPLDPDPRWSEETAREWDTLPEARLIRIEACSPLHSFYPMEVCATAEETAALVRQAEERSFLIFPEHREHPVRMKEDLPFRWIEKGAFAPFQAEAEQGEYFVFQLGLYAHREALEHISLEYSGLKESGQQESGQKESGGAVDAGRFTCFNLEGVDCRGKAFSKDVSLEQNKVRSLWIGLDLPENLRPGSYTGTLTVKAVKAVKAGEAGKAGKAAKSMQESISVTLNLTERKAAFRGDGRPARHSRLRWLNSTLGSKEELIKPYTAVELTDRTFSILGRKVKIGNNGLPSSIETFFTPEVTGIGTKGFGLLKEPVSFQAPEESPGAGTPAAAAPLPPDSQNRQHSAPATAPGEAGAHSAHQPALQHWQHSAPETAPGEADAHSAHQPALQHWQHSAPETAPEEAGAHSAPETAPGEAGTHSAHQPALQHWQHSAPILAVSENGIGTITQNSRSASLTLSKKARLEPDGCLEYRCLLKAEKDTRLSGTLLEIPLAEEAVKYILGLGFTGGKAPESFEWQWNTAEKNQDSVWLGTEKAGLQVFLFAENYRRPLNTNFYRIQPLNTPPSWDNSGKGRISLTRADGVCRLRCSAGARNLKAGEELHFNFRFLITPFRPINTEAQWETRFCHKFGEPREIQDQGASVINVHHANPVNPYINYPFLRPGELKDYVNSVHDLGMKIRLYYTVRELTNHAPEIFALESLDNEIFSKGPGGGHSWLQEHFHGDYIAAWHVFEYGCVAVANSGESRWHNYYVEGLNWLAEQSEIDGVYIDDLAFDRNTMKRVRRVLDRHRKGAIIDLHSANQFNEKDGYANSINLYMEHLPYLDRLWLGEYFDYTRGPEYWMSEVSGIPFGTMGEMLQDGGHLWRGMLYGMTSRYPHEDQGDPRPVWKVWNLFGIQGSRMKGYWSENCPVKTGRKDILATVYEKENSFLVALASWSRDNVKDLILQWDSFPGGGSAGRNAGEWELYSPGMGSLQKEERLAPDSAVYVPADGGRLLILRRKTNG